MNDSYKTERAALGTLRNMNQASLTPRLIVRGADAALQFYQRAFDARIEERFADDTGRVVHAALSIRGAIVALTEERLAFHNASPDSLGGSPVILNLVVDDVDQLGRQLTAAGAKVVFPIADQYYGHREGRFSDPFGHLWIISTITEQLTPAEVESRMRG